MFANWSDPEKALWLGAINVIPQFIIAYVNMEILIPRFFIKKEYITYFIFVLLCFVLLYFAFNYVLTDFFPQNSINTQGHRFGSSGQQMHVHRFLSPYYFRLIFHFTQTVAIFFLSSAYKMSQVAIIREKEATALKNENLQSELKFLKSQINPHFLFNALNNIYTLAVIQSKSAPEMILKLSEMLRYIIYDCNEEKVPLSKEINYIKNYIDLQKLKDDGMVNIKVDIDQVNENLRIAPMLLIPFIENSFKHSNIEDSKKGWIRIHLETPDEKHLNFQIENSIPQKEFTKDKIGGVGLDNVKRRLNLLYPNKHELNITEEIDKFSVNLYILV